VRNEEECVCSVCLFRCNIFIGVRIITEMPGSEASGTLCNIVIQGRFGTAYSSKAVQEDDCVVEESAKPMKL